MQAMFRLSVAILALSLAGSAAAAEGTATGTITANGKVATMKLAKAVKTADGWTVTISDVAVPANEYEAVQKGTLHLLTLEIGAKGELNGWRMGHGGLEGLYLSTSRADFKATKLGPTSIEGTAKKASESYGGSTVAFDVTFKAPAAVNVN